MTLNNYMAFKKIPNNLIAPIFLATIILITSLLFVVSGSKTTTSNAKWIKQMKWWEHFETGSEKKWWEPYADYEDVEGFENEYVEEYEDGYVEEYEDGDVEEFEVEYEDYEDDMEDYQNKINKRAQVALRDARKQKTKAAANKLGQLNMKKIQSKKI